VEADDAVLLVDGDVAPLDAWVEIVDLVQAAALAVVEQISTLLPSHATNAWTMGTSANDVSTLSSLGGVVRTLGATTDALPPRMVRTH
jgi:hypothetical protein